MSCLIAAFTCFFRYFLGNEGAEGVRQVFLNHLERWISQLINFRENLEKCMAIRPHVFYFLVSIFFQSHCPKPLVSVLVNPLDVVRSVFVSIRFHECKYFDNNLLWAVWEFADDVNNIEMAQEVVSILDELFKLKKITKKDAKGVQKNFFEWWMRDGKEMFLSLCQCKRPDLNTSHKIDLVNLIMHYRWYNVTSSNSTIRYNSDKVANWTPVIFSSDFFDYKAFNALIKDKRKPKATPRIASLSSVKKRV